MHAKRTPRRRGQHTIAHAGVVPASHDGATAQYDPGLYARVHRGTRGDEALYRDAARGARSVLELGCGYGRLLVALARAGHAVTGLDSDRGMLALARHAIAGLAPGERARVDLKCADMRGFRLAARFDRVFIPFNGLYCLLREADVLACLERVREHLAPGGRLVFDAYVADDFHAHADPDADDDDGEPVATISWRGRTYDVFETSDWDRAEQRLDVAYHHRPRGGGRPRVGVLRQRYLLRGQIASLCARAGLHVVSPPTDLDGAPLGPWSGHMVWTATAG